MFATVLAIGGAVRAQQPVTEPASESAVKAAFLFNFAKFVEWGEAPRDAAAPFVIGVVGDDPFGTTLDEITRGERIDGRPIAVRRMSRADNLRGCHILFVSDSERRHLPQILDALKGAPVLTVGDTDEFARAGGMIQFVKRNFRIGFLINREAAERGRLRISSKLLSLAQIVETAR